MKSKRLHQLPISITGEQILTLPIVILVLLATVSGCTTHSLVDRHSLNPLALVDRHSGNPRPSSQLIPPYAVPVIRTHPGARATASSKVRRCPSGTLRYCDHRKNRCACVQAADTHLALGTSRLPF